MSRTPRLIDKVPVIGGMFNVYNQQDVEDQVENIVWRVHDPEKNQHIVTWLRGTYRRSLLSDKGSMKLCVPASSLAIRLLFEHQAHFTGTKGKADREFHPLTEHVSEEWAIKALDKAQLVWFRLASPMKHRRKMLHMVDFMYTLPKRTIHHTMENMEAAVKEWDKKIEREKLLTSLKDDVKMVRRFGDHQGNIVVQLMSQEACAAEGKYLAHCVGHARYFSRKNTAIYSLRTCEYEPLFTIEVNAAKRRVEQVQGKSKREPTPEEAEQMRAFFEDHELTFRGRFEDFFAEDDEDDLYEDDEDDEEELDGLADADEEEDDDEEDEELTNFRNSRYSPADMRWSFAL